MYCFSELSCSNCVCTISSRCTLLPIDETSASSEGEDNSQKHDKSKDDRSTHGTAEPEEKYGSSSEAMEPAIPLTLSGTSMSDSEQSQESNESTNGNI